MKNRLLFLTIVLSLFSSISTTFAASSLTWTKSIWETILDDGSGFLVTQETGALMLDAPTGTYTIEFVFTGNISVLRPPGSISINDETIPFATNGTSGVQTFNHVSGVADEIFFHLPTNTPSICDVNSLTFKVWNNGTLIISKETFFTTDVEKEFFLNNIPLSHVTALTGCPDYITLKMSDHICNPQYRLIIAELDAANDFAIKTNTRVEKNLTSLEVSNLVSSTGLSITSLTDNINGNNRTINLISDKYYLITAVDITNGWEPYNKFVHVKSGDWDLIITDRNEFHNFDLVYTGFEPTNSTNVFNSYDIWNKRSTSSDPSSTKHEAPAPVTNPSNFNKLMVEVANIGCVTSPANVPLRLFWTRARTDEWWKTHWIYDMVNNMVGDPNSPVPRPAGSEITISGATMANPYNTNSTPFQLPAISPGTTYKMSYNDGVKWYPPKKSWYNPNNGSMSSNSHPVICLLARIDHSLDPIRYEPTGLTDKILPYVQENNNVATRNTYLAYDPELAVADPNGWNCGFGTVLVNNDNPTANTVDFCIDLLPEEGVTSGTFNDYGSINIGTTTALYNAWLSGGSLATNITVVSPTLFTITNGTHACLENIQIAPGSEEQIGLKFNYNSSTLPATETQYIYQLSQNSGTEETPIYGSNTIYVVDIPTETPILPSPKPRNITQTFFDSQLLLSPNPTNDYIYVQLKDNKFKVGTIKVFDVLGRLVLSENIATEKSTLSLDVTHLPSGTYTLYSEDMDGKKRNATFVKK